MEIEIVIFEILNKQRTKNNTHVMFTLHVHHYVIIVQYSFSFLFTKISMHVPSSE